MAETIDTNEIDLDLEKVVFLFNDSEGNPGIYELVWELGYYNLLIEDKYRIAHEVLTSLLSDKLILLEKHDNTTLTNKLHAIPIYQTEKILNNPTSWYPCNEVYSISLTEAGETYLSQQKELYAEKLHHRLFGTQETKTL